MFKRLKNKLTTTVATVKATAQTKKAEGYVDTGVKILIAVVIGALLLGALYALFQDLIMPTVDEKVYWLFRYPHPPVHSG